MDANSSPLAQTITGTSHNIRDPRRSNGEKELIKRSGKMLLLPQDEAFHPAAEGLKWRSDQLIA
jgi:hypothetical protein